ncbi:LuxR C-terminal-related transcriptional regulator [Nocardia sp. NPDC127526]|uniref:LuxR C-terminal-related transcriptional regulator n=1 Tax=Nocardia sp. NPDC127526 TaxID=3345393 RepID=UPI0036300D15
MLFGRADETAVVEELLTRSAAGHAATLVLRGEAGIGKSVLLDHAARLAAASGHRLLRVSGTEAERDLAFAGLHLLLGRARTDLTALPDAQATALRAALDSGEAEHPNRFLVGAATLTLLAHLSDRTPVLCLIDDAQWLDRATLDTLLFAARRLDAEPIALLFAVRDDHLPELHELPGATLPLARLAETAAATLLNAAHGPLPAATATWLLREANGNPLALQVLPTLRRADRMYTSPFSAKTPTPHRIQRAFTDRILALPATTQDFLLIAATDDTSDPAVILSAAAHLTAHTARHTDPDAPAHTNTHHTNRAATHLSDRHAVAETAPRTAADGPGHLDVNHPDPEVGSTLRIDAENATHVKADQPGTEIATPVEAGRVGTEIVGVEVGGAAQREAARADLARAEQAGLIRVEDGRIVFSHPLVRAAAYDGATAARRREAHRVLAGMLDAVAHADRRAWHLAAAAEAPDEAVAAALDEAARRALGRGGLVEVTAAYRRAADLSPDPVARGRRLYAAARAAAEGGDLDAATEFVERALPLTTTPVALAGLSELQAEIALAQDRPQAAQQSLGTAAAFVAAQDPELAGSLLFRAAEAAWSAGDLAAVAHTAARAESSGLPGADRVRALADLMGGLNPGADVDAGQSITALRFLMSGIADDQLRERATAAHWHLLIADIPAARDLSAALADDCRRRGAVGVLTRALQLQARTELVLGRLTAASAAATEGLGLAAESGHRASLIYQSTTLALLAAIRGDERQCAEFTAEPLERYIAPANVHAIAALSLLDLGIGRPDAAVDRLLTVLSGANRHGAIASIPDLVEAAHRTDRLAETRAVFDWYRIWTDHVGQPWAQAIAQRCLALLADNDTAETHFTAALRLHHAQSEFAFDRARTELLYGEWLRRHQRRAEARTHLRAAAETLRRLGALPWAERAEGELRATGETRATAPTVDVLGRLTPQELQTAQLAATGLSNKDIGAQLFLSPRTVGYHLSNAYPKLGITSRRELAAIFRDF